VFLAVTLAHRGGLGTVVRLQQVAWAILMIALAVTAQATTGNAGGLLPIILVATYPGLQLFSNRVTSYFVALHKSASGLIVTAMGGGPRK